MSKIDLSNFEAYLLDYNEGNLNKEDASRLFLFITLNPDLEIDLSDIVELPYIQEEKVNSGIHHKLHKSEIDIQNQFDELSCKFYNKEITSDEKIQLDYLINQFPNLGIEFIAFAHTYLREEILSEFENKESLKKQFNSVGSFDDLAIKAIERTINKSEEAELKLIISTNSSYQKEWNAFKNAILVEEIIPFPNKELLYKKKDSKNVILLWTARISVAASIIFVLGFFIVNQKSENIHGLPSAFNKPIDSVRKASEIKSIVPEKDINANDLIKKKKQTNQPNQQIINGIDNSKIAVANLDLKSPQIIESFELPSEYIALKPAELQLLKSDAFAMNKKEEEFVKPSQFVWNQIKRILVRNKIDIDKPIEEVKKDGFAEVGFRSLEKVSRGSLVIERENSENRNKITGVQFKGIGFSRSTQ
jgi:hypothetical protein